MYEFAVAPAVTNLRRRGVEITEVEPASLAAELELEAGDRVFRVNGRPVRDYLDFRFHTGGETELTLEVRKKNGEDWELEIERDEGEDFGLGFEQIVPRQCANECIFCFCKGNPDDARPSLFVRDEDIRLSFLYGNYTTLTSISEDEMRRIIDQRLTPQYVSVHSTDLKVRAYLLGVDENRADISIKMQRLLDAGIEVHAQVVLCPGINDGDVLHRTISDLAALYPRVKSLAIVPLGLTRYNTDARLTPVTTKFCQEVVRDISPVQRKLRKRLGTTFAFLGDEIYLRGGHAIPSRRHYGDYPQIEDGIGMVQSFQNELKALRRKLDRLPATRKKFGQLEATVMTGTLFAPAMRSALEGLNKDFGTGFRVVAVENYYFGGDVSVAGLLTGGDFVKAADKIQGGVVIIPGSAIKSDEDVMLDGMTLKELRRTLDRPVFPMHFGDIVQMIDEVYDGRWMQSVGAVA